MKKTLIIALGGNALIKKGQKGTVEEQFRNLEVPLSHIAKVYKKYKLVITHGNGPQVGSILLQQEATDEVPDMPLEVCVAQTQGQIGYMIEKTLDNIFMQDGVGDPLIATLLTYVKVDKKDAAFKNPTKPIGPSYKTAGKFPDMKETAKGWRRVVPSPKPLAIVEHREIKKLLELGSIVICCGGGGIAVSRKGSKYRGIEAVIDKDLASAKLGEEIRADILLIVTDVEGAFLNYGKADQKLLNNLSVAEAKKLLKEKQFASGSMGPKIQAAINFLKAGGERAIICHLNDIKQALAGKAGTQFVK